MAMATSQPMTYSSLPIASASFYGENRSQLTESNEPLPAAPPMLPPYLSDPLLGPSKVWKIFRKQADALALIASLQLNGQLLPFSYESINMERLFLVAHPDVFWFRDCQKKPHLRNSYEIIATDAVCKLYFDLEFDRALNKDSDGNEMTRTLIRVVLYYIRKLFHVRYKMQDVLVLDSSTEVKFSVHLVFQTPLVFRSNIDAGHFVKYVCGEMWNIDQVCSDEEQLKFDIFKETTINIYAIKDLFVFNSKMARALFVDLGVYSRNRLFRLYRSTKLGRQSPLLLSPINKFSPPDPPSDPTQLERQIFLSSLITYFVHPPAEELIKAFEKPLLNPLYSTEVNLRRLEKLHSGQQSPTRASPYPALDDYIRTRVKPHGTIYRNVHFPSTNITVYDIKGYRYCGNIGRWHRSQNIKLIADVNRGVFYQKCHDLECAAYRSPDWPLPPEVLFKIREEEEGDSLLGAVELQELLGEAPGIQEGKPLAETPGTREESGINEGSCIEMKVKGELSEGVNEPSSMKKEVKNELLEQVSEVPRIKKEVTDEMLEHVKDSSCIKKNKSEMSEQVCGSSCKVEGEEPLIQPHSREKKSELTKQSHSSVKINEQCEHGIFKVKEPKKETHTSGQVEEPLNETLILREINEPCKESHSIEKIKVPIHELSIGKNKEQTCANRTMEQPNNEFKSTVKVKEPINKHGVGMIKEPSNKTLALTKKKFPAANTHTTNSSSNHSETRILLDTIENVADKEMVLDYVRNQEKKLRRNDGEKKSTTTETTPPCEPVVKKLKF